MEILIKIDGNGKITNWFFKPELLDDKTGWIEVKNYQRPEQKEGKSAIEYYRDGKIVVEYEDLPPTPEDELEKVKREFQEQLAIRDMAIFDVVNMMMDVAGGGNNG